MHREEVEIESFPVIIFVYGSLRKDGGLHGYLKDSQFLGKVKTKPLYTMYGISSIPHVVEGGDTSLVGELYLVGEKDFYRIDAVEMGYDRKLIELEDGSKVVAYFGDKRWCNENDVVTTGDWMKNQHNLSGAARERVWA